MSQETTEQFPPKPKPAILVGVNLSVVIITYNEEANLPRTLATVKPLVDDGQGEIVVVDSGSTDRTVEIAKSFGAKVFIEEWKGFAAQKNSAIDKATGDWILSLDADEGIEPDLARLIRLILIWKGGSDLGREDADWVHDRASLNAQSCDAFQLQRKNFFLGRWMRHGGFWPDPKLRLFRRGLAHFEDRAVHEDAKLTSGVAGQFRAAILHHAYPTLSSYIEHMNRYSTLGAEMAVAKGYRGFNVIDIVVRPVATFFYNYIFRMGFLDGREGLLLHLYHSVYVSWKYAKAWELRHGKETTDPSSRSG